MDSLFIKNKRKKNIIDRFINKTLKGFSDSPRADVIGILYKKYKPGRENIIQIIKYFNKVKKLKAK